ncbi:hypothetical protein SP15_012 [Bacillus phage SP-15]|uniref:Uncharacterized protein n=1 Tax=Bacillus phage SP-15 TaxID=1792032 RepID=A0A127AYK8_9CAUD|nr:hypothetical protein SP15_012 [Bacillus phage SP-15]AMM44811.1 hypothetical protein SP15_012 [Bacillus phage SP-15]
MRLGKWLVRDESAVSQYIKNLHLIESAIDPDDLYVSNAMLLDHVIDSIDDFLSDTDIDELESHLELIAKKGRV